MDVSSAADQTRRNFRSDHDPSCFIIGDNPDFLKLILKESQQTTNN